MSFPLLGTPKPAFFDSSGAPLASGTLAVLEPSDDTNKASYPTYDDAEALTNANVNPVVLDARGEPPNGLWGLDGEDYKLTLKDSIGTTVWTSDDILVPVDPPGARQTTAESAASKTPSDVSYPELNVKRYGATGDGVTDDTTAILDCIAVAKQITAPMIVIPEGTYITTDTLTFDVPDDTTILWHGIVSSNVSAKPAIRLGDTASETKRITIIGGIRVLRTSDDTAGSSRGVEIRRISFGDVRIANCGGFFNGIVISGEGGGCSHVNLFVNRCHDNMVNLLGIADASGFCNEHKIFGGAFSYSTGYAGEATAVHFQIDHNATSKINNWTLYSPSFEALHVSTKCATIHGTNIAIMHPRIENSGGQDTFELDFTSNSSECVIWGKGFTIKHDNITDSGGNNIFYARDGVKHSYQVAAIAGAQPAASDDACHSMQSTSSNNAALYMGLDTSGVASFAIDASGTAYFKIIEFWGVTDVTMTRGSGTPEAAVTASPGSTYHNITGGAGVSFYVKESGTGNTGWAAK